MRREQRCEGERSSFALVSEIVELSNAIGFGPDTHFPGILERVVVPLDRFLFIKRDGEMIAPEMHTQSVPRAGRNLHAGTLFLCALAFDGVINCDVVFQSVRASNVIVVPVL